MKPLLTGILGLGVIASLQQLAADDAATPRAIHAEEHSDVPRAIPANGQKTILRALPLDENILENPAGIPANERARHSLIIKRIFGAPVKELTIQTIQGEFDGKPIKDSYYASMVFEGKPAAYYNGMFVNPEKILYIYQNGLDATLENATMAIVSGPKKIWMESENGKNYCLLVEREFGEQYRRDPTHFGNFFLGSITTKTGFSYDVLQEELFHQVDQEKGTKARDSEYRVKLLQMMGKRPLYYLGVAYSWIKTGETTPEIYERYSEIIHAIERTNIPISKITRQQVSDAARELLYKTEQDAASIDAMFKK